MKKIIVLIGISGSGKSTYASKLMFENKNMIIVNRDKIRELLFGYTEADIHYYYKRNDLNELEKEVTRYENIMIREALTSGKTVIADSTNLDKKFIQKYFYWNVPVEFVFFDCSLEEAIERDSKRTRQVGEEKIRKQLGRYLYLKQLAQADDQCFKSQIVPIVNDDTKPKCIVFDIDGTLAHMYNRFPYQWDLVGEDIPDEAIIMLSQICILKDVKVFICSGRDEICREETINWLSKYLGSSSNYTLMMRPNKDNRADYKVKHEMWEEICKDYCITCMIDDRSQVVDYARNLGFKVLQCEYNNF